MPTPASSNAPRPGQPAFSLTRETVSGAGTEASAHVFVSGQMAFDTQFKLIDGDIAAQTRQCLRNIEQALAPHGLGLADVVKTTVWLTDSNDFAAFNEAYRQVFEGMTLPARSTVRADLMLAGARIEIEAIAAGRPRATR